MLLLEINGEENREMPRAVYNQCIWIIRDYDRLKGLSQKAKEIALREDVAFYLDDKGGLVSRSVVNEALYKVMCVNEALETIPSEYREGIYKNIVDDIKYGDEACLNTWKKWKKRFIYCLARKLNLY